MPRRMNRRGRRRPVYDWVTTPESYDACVFFGDERSSCDSPQMVAFPLTHAPIMSLDTSTSYGMPNLERVPVAVRGQWIEHFGSPYDPSNLTAVARVVYSIKRIVKAQVDINGDPMTRYTEGSSPVGLGQFESSDEDFLWQRVDAYSFFSNGIIDGILDPAVINGPSFQPRVVDVEVRVSRRLKEDECLFFLWEVLMPVPDPNVPDMNATALLRTLMKVPRT